MTLRLEGVESPHSTACLPNILDSILQATILPVNEISNFGERTFSIDHSTANYESLGFARAV